MYVCLKLYELRIEEIFNFTCCAWVHGLGSEKFLFLVAVPTASVQVPRQWQLVPNVTPVTYIG